MNKELNIGDYIRTKDGIIWKPNKIEEIEGKWFFDDYYWYDKDYIKSSPNIIDLIEVGDIIRYIFNNKEYINKVIDRGTLMLEVSSNFEVSLGLVEIKSIVTKEQFESMEYKIESEANL